MSDLQENEIVGLLQKARNGDAEGLAKMLAPVVYNHVARLLRYDSESEDVAQEVMIVITTKLHQLKEDEAFYGWLMKIVTSKVASFVRRRVATNCLTNMDEFVNADGINKTPDDITLAEEKSFVLKNAIESLDPLERDVIVEFYFNSRKIKEIAAEKDVPVGTVKSRLDRAKTNLRTYLLNSY